VPAPPSGLLHRVAERGRPVVRFEVDGAVVEALEGDTLLTALLTTGRRLRDSEFGDGVRAGFCLMGACQDCWVWTSAGFRVRACSTRAAPDMRILTRPPPWPPAPSS
jgi:hypothetical protein